MTSQGFDEGLPTHPGLRAVARDILPKVLEYYPFWATSLGLHQWDDLMPPTDSLARTRFAHALAGALERLKGLNPAALSPADSADWTVLGGQLQSLWLDESRDHPESHDPNLWNSVISGSLLPVARRQYAPLAERARQAANRLREVPRLLAAARAALDNPPALFVDVAIAQFQATIPLLTDLIPAAFAAAPREAAAVAEAGQVAGKAYGAFAQYLRDELRPRAQGDFRLGEARYSERLALQEAVSIPLPELLRQGYAELDRLKDAFSAAAGAIAPGQTPQQVLHEVGARHPSAEHLLGYVAKVLGELESFCRTRDLMTIPPVAHPEVVQTPPFLRMTTFASIDPPGPFEPLTTQAYYQVTLPDPHWPASDIEGHLRGYNHWATRIISAHEVYPGHFVQFLHFPRGRSTIRKVLPSNAFIEGWAHYVEEMLVEEGYGDGQPQMRLMQTMEALERVGRFIVAIRLHAGDMTLDAAQAFFETECLMAPVNARREALRGTMDPFYLIYTLGKLEFLRLRERARREPAFRLGRFHDSVLSHGAPPLPVLEKLLF
ncbi:MAG: DUF885 domain-containing protein [Thermaerobacter sp.]|nr:DUF885 domain-containing protein [Thermaerobacter sp.]